MLDDEKPAHPQSRWNGARDAIRLSEEHNWLSSPFSTMCTSLSSSFHQQQPSAQIFEEAEALRAVNKALSDQIYVLQVELQQKSQQPEQALKGKLKETVKGQINTFKLQNELEVTRQRLTKADETKEQLSQFLKDMGEDFRKELRRKLNKMSAGYELAAKDNEAELERSRAFSRRKTELMTRYWSVLRLSPQRHSSQFSTCCIQVRIAQSVTFLVIISLTVSIKLPEIHSTDQ